MSANNAWAKLVIRHELSDLAAKEIETLVKKSLEKNVAFTFENYKKNHLQIKKEYQICNNCWFIKDGKTCNECRTDSATNNFILFDIKEQLKDVVERNVSLMKNCAENIEKLGYLKTAKIFQIHDATDNAFTFTLNTDGLQVFNNNSKDCWPFFLAVNELPVKTKYSLSNIILAGIWVGSTKINNSVILNDLMKEIGHLEEGLELNGERFNFFCIYGSFDKPARALILNIQNFNGTFGCPFCLAESRRINMKPTYTRKGKKRTHNMQIGLGIRAANSDQTTYGVKGISSLR